MRDERQGHPVARGGAPATAALMAMCGTVSVVRSVVLTAVVVRPGTAAPEPVQGVDPDHRDDRDHGNREDPDDGEYLGPRSPLRLQRHAATLEEGLREQV